MNYVSTYRKYRPLTFDDVVGQEHIVKTLKNAIENDKLAHAYLFNGPRGTGKTSIAKIFARQINCVCEDNSCTVCTLENEVAISDIIEMDAASNNSVEEIRKIVESVNYVPLELKYKVYIIDEVHMLSKSAFNALLKTIEEPPKHVKFILATTEINKIPLTIVSRTQRFDFKKITIEDIVKRLSYVLEKEQIKYEDDALLKLATLADGGLRDSLSLLDKVIMYEKEITLNSVNKSLNLVDDDIKNELFKSLYNKDSSKLLSILKNIDETGVDEYNFIIDFQYYIRSILIDIIEKRNLEYNQNILIIFLKQLMELQTRLLHTRNYKLLIEVYLLELCVNKESTKLTFDSNKKEEVTIDKSENKVEESKQETILEENKKETIVEEPVVNEPEILSGDENINNEQVVTQEKVQSKNDDIPDTMMDVLVKATQGYRKELHLLYPTLVDDCYSENKRALARFFEGSQICAVSELGCVVSLEQDLVETFKSRIDTINEYLSNKLNRNITTFIISFDDWNTNKLKYAETVKEIRSNNDIYGKAVEIFGSDIVQKI